jgi:hypothetical protein
MSKSALTHASRAGIALVATGLLASALGLAVPAIAQAQGLPPFTGLSEPTGIAVDAAGDVFVADAGNNSVVELPGNATTSSQQVTLPFTGLSDPQAAAVDSHGDVFVADTGNNSVVELRAGSDTQVTLPFTGLNSPQGVAVDSGGDVFVADTGNDQVDELPAGSATQVTLPFTGLNFPASVGVDAAGDVFASSAGLVSPPEIVAPAQIFELTAGSSTQKVLSAAPVGAVDEEPVMAVDAEGDVFIGAYGSVDSDDAGWVVADTVVEVTAGATEGTVIDSQFGTDAVTGIAVDPVHGDVLVDFGAGQPTDIGQYAPPEPQATPLSVSTASLAQAVAGTAYSQQLQAAGGTAPYTWKITAGSLPAGLTLNGNGTIAGTPKAAGTATLTVEATDAGHPAQTATQQLSLTVAADKADLAVSVTGPASVKAGTAVTYTLTVSDKGPAPASSLTVVLSTSGLTGVTPSAGGSTKSITVFGTKLTGSVWTAPSLAPGHSDTFTVTGSAPTTAGKAASATGGALAVTPDPDILNNISLTSTKTTK